MVVTSSAFVERLWASRDNYFRLRDDKLAVQIGATLAALVLILTAIHIITFQNDTPIDNHEGIEARIFAFVNLGSDYSISETLNHGMLFVAALLFLAASFEQRARAPFVISLCFFLAWIDDSAQYHERVGGFLGNYLQLPSAPGLRRKDSGELLAWGLAAAALLPVAFWAFRGRRHGDGSVVRLVALPIAGLVFCGVVFDMMHVAVEGPRADLILTVMEDGGEMLSIAAAVAVSLAVLRNSRKIYQVGSPHRQHADW